MKVTEEGYVFESTGRTALSHGTTSIGIGKTDGEFDITLGFDNYFTFQLPDDDKTYDYFSFAQSEKEELADYMIAMWTKFKNS